METGPTPIVVLEYGGGSVALAPGKNVVGRALTCQVRFNDPSVSRQHLQIALEAGKIVVEDLGSANGTLVDGEQLAEPMHLEGGEEIKIGQRIVRIRRVEDPYDDPDADEETLTEWMQTGPSGTLSGLPVIEPPTSRTCPKCRARVPIEERSCPECNYLWPSGRPSAVTQPIPLQDQREHARTPLVLPLLYSSDEHMFDAVARNLSQGGLFVATTEVDAPNTKCNVTLLPEGGPAVSFNGVVRHVVLTDSGHPPGMGIEFIEKSKADEQWLTDLLRQHPAD